MAARGVYINITKHHASCASSGNRFQEPRLRQLGAPGRVRPPPLEDISKGKGVWSFVTETAPGISERNFLVPLLLPEGRGRWETGHLVHLRVTASR